MPKFRLYYAWQCAQMAKMIDFDNKALLDGAMTRWGFADLAWSVELHEFTPILDVYMSNVASIMVGS